MTTEDTNATAVAGPVVQRGVRPHAIRLASQLQSAAYSHGYEDGHPSNATTRQDKYGAASQRLLSELREAIELLISERDKARRKALQDAARWVDEEVGHAVQDGWSVEAVQALLATRDMLKAHAEMMATVVAVPGA